MASDVVSLLQELVRIPSVNPMGRDVAGEIYFEARLTSFLQQYVADWGFFCERQHVSPQRENLLIATVDLAKLPPDRPILMLEAHQDTVPVDGMSIDPFAGEIKNGRIYGRGSCDIKGGMAAMLMAISKFRDLPAEKRPAVVLALAVNEEHGFSGAKRITRCWSEGESKLLTRPPAAVLVSEPTLLDVVVSHKGVARWKCHAQGVAAHSSNPKIGANAIYRMSRIVTALEKHAENLPGTVAPLIGGPTLSVGIISGGVSVNTVPDHCVIEIDRRLAPGDNPLEAQQAAIDFVAKELGNPDWIQHNPPFIISPGLAPSHNQELASSLLETLAKCGVSAKTIGVPYGTDGAILSQGDVPTVVCGPGDIAQAHTHDEWLAIDQLEKSVEVYEAYCRKF
ncbi:M20 family metallopeptidase [Blastopirellula sp. JC732]|uniref:Probable succinyl-diaminopimelate desuccinylase n=1 Tax=Blastopirellula sediminis TaxID=2894196 RepID=A0A9X1MSG3_9BACT|nr:M20 family metallopeptidase [Blastopirellula sediminis]MCC9605150.1 M20 family metallopeptidase [Blastopirellula sediminis]MCC9631550.1 M20 family metallopeptidase [Blastopirellula sediminis]